MEWEARYNGCHLSWANGGMRQTRCACEGCSAFVFANKTNYRKRTEGVREREGRRNGGREAGREGEKEEGRDREGQACERVTVVT